MFRRVRELAVRGRRQAVSLLASVGRAVKKVGLRLGVGTLAVGRVFGTGVQLLTRGVSWTWMSVVEVYSLTQAPFIWVIGNVGFWAFRGIENTVNWIRKTDYDWAHRSFPAFSILNAWSMTNIALYPLVALVGWLLSPFTSQSWWRSTAHGYKVRTVALADFDYVERAKRDLAFDKTMGEPPVEFIQPESEERVSGRTPEQREAEEKYVEAKIEESYQEDLALGPELYKDRATAQGFVQIYFDPNFPEEHDDSLIYLQRRINDVDPTEFDNWLISLKTDPWGRHWAQLPDGVDTTPPELKVEEVDEHGLVNFTVAEHVDYTKISDPKERSYYFGVEWLKNSAANIPDFLTNTLAQDKARALVFTETKNPQSGLLSHYALKGFNEALEDAVRELHNV